MPAREGFLTADIGVLALHHRRIRKLRNDLGESEAAVLTVIWLELVLGSWAEGDRLELVEIDSPAELTDERIERLRAAGLVDASGRLPSKAWAEWFGAAADRRADRRARGQKAAVDRWSGKRSSSNASSNAQAMPEHPSNGQAMPEHMLEQSLGNTRPSVRPTVPSERTVRTVSTREPARPSGAPSRAAAVAVYCVDPSTHRAGYQWFGEHWRCMPCERSRAEADPLTFREKVDRAANAEDLANTEPEGMF